MFCQLNIKNFPLHDGGFTYYGENDKGGKRLVEGESESLACLC